MLAKLQNDSFIFSGLKTHAQLLEASSFLTDKDGKIKSFSAFAQDFNKVNEKYNQNYLEAEHQFAINSSQMAANWAATDPDGRYNLQYRTANDDRVRENHRVLQDITLPKEDSFWLSYYPPNGWRCRCTAVEVRKSKYPESDSKKAIEAGEKATSHIGKDGKNKLEIFRFNPGAENKVFPPKHPYNKVKGAEQVKEKLSEKPLENVTDLSKHFEKYAENNPEMFQRGYSKIIELVSKTANGSTDGSGTIKLQPEIINLINDGINNIRNKTNTTFDQEKAISTLHHEIWHNANKPGADYRRMPTDSEIKTMELANEFVARKTLPEFMEKLGGRLQNYELTGNRDNTGYNTMVRNYDHLIEWTEAKPEGVLNTVRTHLIDEDYKSQRRGLIDGIINNCDYKLKIKTVETIIKRAETLPEEDFKALLQANNKLLVSKNPRK
ncbi:MAG: phage minor head protein [Chryseobacterium sp.]